MRCRLQSVSWSGLGIPARASGVRRKTCACAIVNVPSIARPAFKLPFGVPHSKWREQYDGARLGPTQQANASPYRADSSAYSRANASTRWYQAVPDTSRRRRPRRRYVALLAKPAAIAEHKHALHTHFCAGTAHICAGTAHASTKTGQPRVNADKRNHICAGTAHPCRSELPAPRPWDGHRCLPWGPPWRRVGRPVHCSEYRVVVRSRRHRPGGRPKAFKRRAHSRDSPGVTA
jgi:hypothetical protein